MTGTIEMFGDEREPMLSEARRARFDVDRTPIAIPRQSLPLLVQEGAPLPRKVLDLCAGDGPWGRAALEEWPGIELHAIEVREEERAGLEGHCERVVIGSARDPQALAQLDHDYDLILGNVPFGLPDPLLSFDEKVGEHRKSRAAAFRAFVPPYRNRLAKGGTLALYAPVQWWLRSASCVALAQLHPCRLQLNIPLPIGHRERGSAATDAYAVFAWSPIERTEQVPWVSRLNKGGLRYRKALELPPLSRTDRRWRRSQ